MRNFLLTAGLSEEAADRPISGYSKGMRRKVAIAIAYAKEAKVLLGEPTSGLGSQASYVFSNLLLNLTISRSAFEFDQSLVFSHSLDRQRGADGIEGKV